MKAGSQSSRSGLSLPSWTLSALGGAAALALLFTAAAVYGFLQPAQRAETVERLRFEHTAAFQYTVHTQPSLLYPQEIIGPIGPASPQAGGAAGFQKIDDQASSVAVPTDEAMPFAGPPVFTRLARSLDLNFTYQLISELPAEVRGQVGIDLQIKAGESWVSTRALVTPVPFNGPTATVQAALDFPQILEFLQAVEEQTGFDPGTYEIALIPTVQLIGLVGGQPIEEGYAPAFTLSLNDTQIHLDPELARSDIKRIEEPVMRPNQIDLAGFALPVQALRLVGLLGAILSLLAAGVLAVVYLGANRGEVSRIRARYGGLIVPVAEADLGAGRQVQVAAMPDLARLAQRAGSLIFHQSLPSGEIYFVPDGQSVYVYQVTRPDRPG